MEIDKVLLRRYAKLLILRLLTLLANALMVLDTLGTKAKYNNLFGIFQSQSANSTVEPTIARPSQIGYCDLTKVWKEEEVTSLLGQMDIAFFLLLGVLGIAVTIFLMGLVVNIRLILFPQDLAPDALGRFPQTIWDRLRDMTFALATFPCDMIILSCVIGLFAVRRGSEGLGCWECQTDVSCAKTDDFEKSIQMNGIALNVNFLMVTFVTLYKVFLAYYRWADPGKCDCACVAPRCVTGCFVSLIATSVILMPPLMVIKIKFYQIKGISGNIVADILDKMSLIGLIIWIVILIFALVILPLKRILLGGNDKKKGKK